MTKLKSNEISSYKLIIKIQFQFLNQDLMKFLNIHLKFHPEIHESNNENTSEISS